MNHPLIRLAPATQYIIEHARRKRVNYRRWYAPGNLDGLNYEEARRRRASEIRELRRCGQGRSARLEYVLWGSPDSPELNVIWPTQ